MFEDRRKQNQNNKKTTTKITRDQNYSLMQAVICLFLETVKNDDSMCYYSFSNTISPSTLKQA